MPQKQGAPGGATEKAPKSGSRDERREALKAEIRSAARRLFMERGFDGSGVRDIAAAVGVNPAIVIRHFGSKEALFLETMAIDSRLTEVLAGPIDKAGEAVVAAMIDAHESAWKTFAALVRASGREEVSARLRETFEHGIAPRLVPRLDGEDTALRAHLFVAQLAGLLTAFAVYEDTTLSGASRDAIVRIYGESMQRLLTP